MQFSARSSELYLELRALEAYDSSYDFAYNIIMNIVSGVGMSVWKIIKFLKNALIGLIVSVYLLAKRKHIKQQGSMLLHSILKPPWKKFLF